MAGFSYAKYFGDINLLADLQFMPGEKAFIDRPSAACEQKDLLLYLGCNVLRTAHLARTVILVLQGMGFDFNAAGGPAHCCGIVHHNQGDTAASRGFAANSMRHFAKYGAKHVLMWCPSCNEHYDEVVGPEQGVAFPYEHVTAFLARHLDRVRFVRPLKKRVALHYHCGSPQSDADWQCTARILQAIPGLELVQIPHSAEMGRHCTPKWIGRMGRQRWRQTIRETMEQARQAEVDVVATIYHSCHREICEEERDYPFQIINYISLLGAAMGIDDTDSYKHYKLLADPAAVYKEVQGHVLAHGLDAERVRGLLDETFAPRCRIDLDNPS